ncbi:programmed cell death protein 1-like [Lithobates pipiens]
MSMERLCLIFCSICVSAVLVSNEVIKLSHTPVRLQVRLGEMAVFTCNFTALNFTPKDINWYRKTNSTSFQKIADSKDTENKRLNITADWGRKRAVLYIKNVTLNDSGQYKCQHLYVDQNGEIFSSNTSALIVENLHYLTTTVTDQTKQQVSAEHQEINKMTVIVMPIILVLILLLLIGIATFLVWYKQRNKMPQPQLRHLEKPSQNSEVYTVDYGVLDFGNNQPYRKSAEISIQEQVEYATIMFP